MEWTDSNRFQVINVIVNSRVFGISGYIEQHALISRLCTESSEKLNNDEWDFALYIDKVISNTDVGPYNDQGELI